MILLKFLEWCARALNHTCCGCKPIRWLDVCCNALRITWWTLDIDVVPMYTVSLRQLCSFRINLDYRPVGAFPGPLQSMKYLELLYFRSLRIHGKVQLNYMIKREMKYVCNVYRSIDVETTNDNRQSTYCQYAITQQVIKISINNIQIISYRVVL